MAKMEASILALQGGGVGGGDIFPRDVTPPPPPPKPEQKLL